MSPEMTWLSLIPMCLRSCRRNAGGGLLLPAAVLLATVVSGCALLAGRGSYDHQPGCTIVQHGSAVYEARVELRRSDRHALILIRPLSERTSLQVKALGFKSERNPERGMPSRGVFSFEVDVIRLNQDNSTDIMIDNVAVYVAEVDSFTRTGIPFLTCDKPPMTVAYEGAVTFTEEFRRSLQTEP